MSLPHLTPERPAAFVFDCDGVLIESVQIKTDAFAELFADHPRHRDAIVAHHEENLGVSRFEKFAWIYRELLGREIDESESRALGDRFSQLVFEAACSCPTVPGAEECLARLGRAGLPLYVASGTPQGELEAVIEARGWTSRFRGIHGSPRHKTEILQEILRENSAAAENLVFVGDGWSDYRAARETGAAFVLRETKAQAHRFAAYQGPRMTDLYPLTEYNLDVRDA